MGQRKQNKYDMDFVQRVQSDASDIVADAKFLTENKLAWWQKLVLPDGKEHVALVFSPTAWEVVGDRLQLRANKS